MTIIINQLISHIFGQIRPKSDCSSLPSLKLRPFPRPAPSELFTVEPPKNRSDAFQTLPISVIRATPQPVKECYRLAVLRLCITKWFWQDLI